MEKRNWRDRCWVTTIFLVRSDGQVLLSWNQRLNTWIPPGGHLEVGDNPDEAIIREVQEELPGFKFEFFPPPHYENQGQVKVIKPFRIQIEKVPHHHLHLNFIFFGKCLQWTPLLENDEGDKLKWFSQKELEQTEMLESVKKLALAALKALPPSCFL